MRIFHLIFQLMIWAIALVFIVLYVVATLGISVIVEGCKIVWAMADEEYVCD